MGKPVFQQPASRLVGEPAASDFANLVSPRRECLVRMQDPLDIPKQLEFCIVGFAPVFRNVNEIPVVICVLFRRIIDCDDVIKLTTLGLELGKAFHGNVFACAQVST